MSGIMPADVSQMLSRGIAAADRGEYAAAPQLLGTVYKLVPADKMPQGLSSYGLCLARVQKKQKMGIELCHKAMEMQFYDGMHWANLVRVYTVGNSRRKAVETLDSGLKKLGNDPALLRVRQEIGYRQAPSLTFLPRRNPVNKLFSRTASKLNPEKLTRGGKVIAIITGVLLYAAMIAAVFKAIVK